MSDAQNLNDFFAQQSKKNKKSKKGAAKTKPAAAKQAEEEKAENTAAAAATQPEPTKEPAQDFADSSDDESNQIVINEGSKKIVDRKDLEAGQKKKETEAEGLAAWGLGTKIGQAPETDSKPSMAPLKGVDKSGAGQIQFGKPTFTRKQKGVMDTQDFPDLDDTTKGGKGAAATSKADGAMMFMSGATAKGARTEGENKDEEAKAPTQATKPVFRGKAKFNTGGASNDEVQNSRMNYDFSKMRMSAATTKTKEGEKGGDGEQGEQRQRREPGAPKRMMDFSQDDDFEVVQDKPKRQPGHNRGNQGGVDNMDFGRGKPSFTRGSK